MASTSRIEISRDAEKILRNLSEMGVSGGEIRKVSFRVLDREGQLTAAHTVRTKASGQRLGVRSGTLRRSIVGGATEYKGDPAMVVGVFRGPALAYAGVQEFGTVGKGGKLPTIRPKNGKALAIPVGPVLTPAGVPRYDSPLQDPELPSRESGEVYRPFKGPGAFGGLFSLDGVLRWVLVSKVDITPKHYLLDSVNERLPAIAESLARAFGRVLTGKIDPKGL